MLLYSVSDIVADIPDAAERGVIATDRAWIEIELAVTSNFVVGEKDIAVRAKATFKNVGRSPAVNVSTMFRLFPDAAVASQEIDDFVRKRRQGFVGPGLDYGQVLFPDRDFTAEENFTLPRAEFLARIKEIGDTEMPRGEERVPYTHSAPALMAFAQYRLPSEGNMGGYHFSTMILDICSRDKNHPGFDGSPIRIGQSELELLPTAFSGQNT